MARKKYFTLSTGYKVEQDQNDTDSHLMAAIVGEACTEVKRFQDWPTLEMFADAVIRRVYQECEYLSRRYDLSLWRLLGATTDVLFEIVDELQQKFAEANCADCEHKDECATVTRERCDPSEMN